MTQARNNSTIPERFAPIRQHSHTKTPPPSDIASYRAIRLGVMDTTPKCPIISDFQSGLHYESCTCTISISNLPILEQFSKCHGRTEEQELLKQTVFICIVRALQQLFAEGDIAGKHHYLKKTEAEKEGAFVQNGTLRFRFTYLVNYREDPRTKRATITISLLWSGNQASSTLHHPNHKEPSVMSHDDIKKHASLVYEALHSDIAAFIDRTYTDAIASSSPPDYYFTAQPGIIPAYYQAPSSSQLSQ